MAFWLFSGGSTGFPKGVVHLHHDIPYTCETFAKEILADHRGRRHVQLDQALPRVRAGQQPDVPVLGRRDDGPADGQARPARPAGDRAGATGRACSSASPRCTARWSTCPTRPTYDLSSRPLLRVAPPSRSRPRSTPLEGRVRPRHRRRHRLDRDAAHLLLQPPRRRQARDERQARARATSWCCSTSSASRCRRARSATCTSAATARSPTTGISTRRPRPRSRATCSSPATATAQTTTATTSTRAAPTT